MGTHKDLEVWKGSMAFVTEVYGIARSFPKEELFGLTSQIKRCAVSIPSNIAEGAARQHKKENLQFLYVASGSLSELETQLIISHNLGFINEEKLSDLTSKMILIRAQLHGLIKYLKKTP